MNFPLLLRVSSLIITLLETILTTSLLLLPSIIVCSLSSPIKLIDLLTLTFSKYDPLYTKTVSPEVALSIAYCIFEKFPGPLPPTYKIFPIEFGEVVTNKFSASEIDNKLILAGKPNQRQKEQRL